MSSSPFGPTGNLRIVVFTCGHLGRVVADELRSLSGVDRVVVVSAPYRTRRRTGIDKVRHIYKYEGVWGLLEGVRNRLTRALPGNTPRLTTVPAADDPDQLWFPDFHSAECIAAVAALEPDLGVVVGTYILKPDLFEIPRLGSINLHTGKAPEYRGSAPAFWEMFNGERQVGITIHRVAEDLDAGAILRQETFPLDPAPPSDPLAYIERYRDEVLLPNGVRLLRETVEDILHGRAHETPQDTSRARTYRLPTYAEKRELRRRVRLRRRRGFKRAAKSLLGWVLFNSGLYRRFVRGKAYIVLFHRVDDRYPGNPISCSREEFDRYCRFFKRFFHVVSASALADLIERGQDLSGKLVITFDDGYEDNLAAARVLKAHGLTACFFIATDFIGTDRNGWWDVEQGCRSRWMSWDDVRQLRNWGFEVGAHTATHVDLGATHGAEAVAEIKESKHRLEAELGTPIAHFAYPFGGRQRMTQANLAHVAEAGFRTCMSAYGGVVTSNSSLLDLHRFAISPWHRSPWQAGFELLREPELPDLTRGNGSGAPSTSHLGVTDHVTEAFPQPE